MNEAEIIAGAREILSDPKRWHKGSFGSPEGAVCAMGAMGMASSVHRVEGCYSVSRTHPLHRALLLVEAHVPGGILQYYNDDPDTTHADILTLLDKCLADLGAL